MVDVKTINKMARKLYKYVDHCLDNDVTPNIYRFCMLYKINRSTWYKWVKKHEVIADSHEYLMNAQGADLIEGGLGGTRNARIASLMLQSNHGMTERTEHQGNPERPVEVNPHDPAEIAAKMRERVGDDK